MMKLIFALLALIAPATVLAAGNVTLKSDVLVERVTQDASGATKTVLEPPAKVTPGDHVVFVLTYQNLGPQAATDFVVTDPVPAEIAFAGTEDASASLSVDGGKSWGPLASLKVKQADGTLRVAQAADVTHIRWSFAAAIPAGQAGKLSFRGVVK
jgi:uncharacterized repeat protein (TIGR01451 family)